MNDRDDAERGGIDCEEAVRRLAEYLDRELDPSEHDEVERHLDRCRSCYSRAEFERKLKERIRSDVQVDEVPAAFEDRVRDLLRNLPEGS